MPQGRERTHGVFADGSVVVSDVPPKNDWDGFLQSLAVAEKK